MSGFDDVPDRHCAHNLDDELTVADSRYLLLHNAPVVGIQMRLQTCADLFDVPDSSDLREDDRPLTMRMMGVILIVNGEMC